MLRTNPTRVSLLQNLPLTALFILAKSQRQNRDPLFLDTAGSCIIAPPNKKKKLKRPACCRRVAAGGAVALVQTIRHEVILFYGFPV